jgi:transcriptional regulator with XRE-family HTH domain
VTLQEKTRVVRERLHLTQKELAFEIGTNQTEISFIERGFIPPDENKIIAINNLFDRSDNKWAVE